MSNPEEDYAVWWFDGTELVMRLFAIQTSTFELSATGEVRDKSGRLVRQPKPQLVWNESFRYFRLAQVTDDALDAYRNLYLALECLLDEHAPHKRGEPEGAWLRRALAPIHAAINLSRFAPSVTSDPVAAIVRDLYSTTRTSVFHAKIGRDHVLPGNRGGVRQVRQRIERLAGLYLALVEHLLGMRRAASGISQYAFNQMVSSGPWATLTLAVSDDSSPFDPADEWRVRGLRVARLDA
jgi:hypothetical protein